MYKTVSKDGGVNWTAPVVFAPNGVNPNLLLLNNGTLCVASGRPGLQLRFNIDGDGEFWTEPIEMMPFMDANGNYIRDASVRYTCGYFSYLIYDDNSFYIVYSDFKKKDSNGEERKAIMFRKVEVVRK